MKKSLFILIIAFGFTQITQAQVTCADMNLIVNVGSIPDYVNIYHPGHYLTSPREDNVISWTITDNEGNIIAEDTLIDESNFSFNHNIPTTDTMHVSAVLTNDTSGVACSIEDVLYWKEEEVIPGAFIYSWEFLFGNFGTTLGLNDLTPTVTSIYPNPTNDIININLDEGQLSKIELYSMTGRLLFKTDLNSNTYTLNMGNYASGSYFVRVFNQKNVFVNKKIIKN